MSSGIKSRRIVVSESGCYSGAVDDQPMRTRCPLIWLGFWAVEPFGNNLTKLMPSSRVVPDVITSPCWSRSYKSCPLRLRSV